MFKTNLLSSEFNFISDMKIIVPESVHDLCKALHGAISNQSIEFGFFLKSIINIDAGEVVIYPVDLSVGTNFEVPKQRATVGTIAFDEEPSDASFNTVIHRHPAGCTSFSTTDMSSINEEFDVSLIFIPNSATPFPDALVNYRINDDTFIRFRVSSKNVIIRKSVTAISSFIRDKAKNISVQPSRVKLVNNPTSKKSIAVKPSSKGATGSAWTRPLPDSCSDDEAAALALDPRITLLSSDDPMDDEWFLDELDQMAHDPNKP